TEREELVIWIAQQVEGRVPLIIGASSEKIKDCRCFGQLAERVDAEAYLVAVPNLLYKESDEIVPFFQNVSDGIELPLIIQDLEFNGPGLNMRTIEALRGVLPTLLGMKIETIPAGPKYTAIRQAFGKDFFVAGGWAIMQMIEALDRGVDAMIPESSMVKVYSKIFRYFVDDQRVQSLQLFRRLLPILTFSNQDLGTSIAFFKRLLVKKGIFQNATVRNPDCALDSYQLRVADELINYYLDLEKAIS
ncbi:MAG: dihydrodipicolinate synthase family protein, partial [Candidatus Poribacteria bacterium]|nr:dihydrodipicolinate synthase family protein [Candidatus Poribacteria bacterium]